jgi:uncharacterized protein DUF5677
MSDTPIDFGFPEFWPVVYKAYETPFHALTNLANLASEMMPVADKNAKESVEKTVHVLTRLTAFGLNDAILLCGNGCGTGAMKIVRGMFESSALAEYLRRTPKEVDDYIDFGRVLAWRRYHWLLTRNPKAAQRFAPEKVIEIEDEYNRVKGRFMSKKGIVRHQWSLKGMGQIAKEIGRTDQYELIYSLCSSMNHANFEGVLGYVEMKDGDVTMDGPPTMAWVGAALICAHTYLLFALNTLNECCKLGFDDKIQAASQEFNNVWKEKSDDVWKK